MGKNFILTQNVNKIIIYATDKHYYTLLCYVYYLLCVVNLIERKNLIAFRLVFGSRHYNVQVSINELRM